jgi:response regulator RpfG family c-di-GMP phosphodiesterase
LKPGRLTEEEWKIMREHPVVGERICAPLKSFRLVLPIIRHHHEKFDGSGYPDGLRGDAIPLAARVLQIVDVYDALMGSGHFCSIRTASQAQGWFLLSDCSLRRLDIAAAARSDRRSEIAAVPAQATGDTGFGR